MQGTIARMDKKGYLCTVYIGCDRKTKYAVLTDFGNRLAEDIYKTINSINDNISVALTKEERAELVRLPGKIQTAVQ